MEEEQREFLRKIERSISYCRDRPSNLLGIFRPEQIEDLLSECMKIIIKGQSPYRDFVELVVRSGYKHVPRVDEDGEPLLPRRTTPIHRAANRQDHYFVPPAVVRELFRIYSWDTNYTDETGSTHLYAAIKFGLDDVVQEFFELRQDPNCVAHEGMGGVTALQSAVHFGKNRIAESLLRRGADPTLTRRRPGGVAGSWTTLLHDSCGRSNSAEFARMLLDCIDERTQRPRLRVDARDDLGNTPLHLALHNGEKETAEVFLRNGADPNLANAEGATALHFICKIFDPQGVTRDWAEQFFEICDDVDRRIARIDAEDESGRTPLQWAVATIKPHAVATLLDRGADIDRFVFPTEHFFGASFPPNINYSLRIKVNFASGALLALEYLENAGYELDRGDALTVMKFFPRYGLSEEPAVNLEECWYDDEAFASQARNAMVFPDWSLYDLIRMQPEEAAKRLSYKDYFASLDSVLFSSRQDDACAAHLCEKLSRRFFRSWALETFMELIEYRLPLEVCEIIIDKPLTNINFCNICLATTIRSS